MECKPESAGRAIDLQSQQVMRQQAVKALQQGQSVQSVATEYGANVRTVFRRIVNFISAAPQTLVAKPISWRPPKITAEQMAWLAKAAKDNTPQQFKSSLSLWPLAPIRELIKREFGQTLAASSTCFAMKLLGISAQKPLYQAWQQDAVLVRQREAQDCPAIRKDAKEKRATNSFADDAGLRSDYHTGTTLAPRAETPVPQKTRRRFAIHMISAVSSKGEFRFMLHNGSVTAKGFKTFLERLLIGAEAPVFVVLDGHIIHKAKLIKPFVEEQQGRLKLFYLPPYSPHLNPDESVWAHVKREVSTQLVEDLEEMKRLALSALRRIQKLPDLVQSFFRQPECRYIIE